MTGILSYGVHLPVLRLSRAQILAAHGWYNPALAPLATGERAICNWDEDALTMAVEAARAALTGGDHGGIARVLLASTSLPYVERSGSAVLCEALGLETRVMPLDAGGSTRAGVATLLTALQLDAASGATLCVASDDRPARPASAQEMLFGAGAAAFVVGRGKAIATLRAVHSRTADFVDRLRAPTAHYGFQWEERWIRDGGHLGLLPETALELLGQQGLTGADIQHLVLPLAQPQAALAVAKRIGVAAECVVDTLYERSGDLGAALSSWLLVAALEKARPGERLLVCGFGQGCDALLLEAADALPRVRTQMTGVAAALARRHAETNYMRYLVGSRQLDVEAGIRGEAQRPTAPSVAWRERRTVLGFQGGRCRRCGTVQFPAGAICVDPACKAHGDMEPVGFAGRRGRILNCTADHLAASLRPPVHYGMVEFEGGGRVLLEFADTDAWPPQAGTAVRMVFRLRRVDPVRQWRNYFWKATGVGA